MCSISTLWEHNAEFCKVAASDTCILMIELELSYLQWLLEIYGYFTVSEFGILSCPRPFRTIFIWPLAANNVEIYCSKTSHTILHTISLNKKLRKYYSLSVLMHSVVDVRHRQMGKYTSQQCSLTQGVCALLGALKTHSVQQGCVVNEWARNIHAKNTVTCS